MSEMGRRTLARIAADPLTPKANPRADPPVPLSRKANGIRDDVRCSSGLAGKNDRASGGVRLAAQ